MMPRGLEILIGLWLIPIALFFYLWEFLGNRDNSRDKNRD